MEPTLLTGNDLIDSQHQQLFDLLDLLELGLAAKRAEAIQNALLGLMGHVVYHFADEEHLHRSCGFMGLEGHIRAHNAIIEALDEVSERFQRTLNAMALGLDDMEPQFEAISISLNLMVCEFLDQLTKWDLPLAQHLQNMKTFSNT